MASQYIDAANQEMLWNLFHKIPKVASFEYNVRQSIFQESLGEMYEQITPNVFHFSRDELKEWNKKTIAVFVRRIQDILGPSTTVAQSLPSVPSPTYADGQYVYETLQEQTNKQFEEKQKQYESMTRKPNVPKPSDLFQEPTSEDDGAIQNMDELIAQYQQQRDNDLPPLSVPKEDGSPKEILTKRKTEREYLEQILEKLTAMEHRLTNLESRLPEKE